MAEQRRPRLPRAVRKYQTDDHNAERILRLFAQFIAGGFVIYLVLLMPAIREESAHHDPWWTPLGVFLAFVPGTLLLPASFLPGTVWIERCGIATGIGFLLAVLTWPLSWTGTPLTAEAWPATFFGLATMAVGLTGRTRLTVGYLVIVGVLVQLLNQARLPALKSSIFLELPFALGFSLLFVAAALMALRTGRLLDETRSDAYEAAALAAAMRARNVERERFGDLLHDWVMSSLGGAARQPHSPAVRRQATVTLRKLDLIGSADDRSPFDSRDALAYLRSCLTDVDPSIPVDVAIPTEAEGSQFDAAVVRTIGTGLAEAVRNSRRHAGENAECRVHIDLGAGHLAVAVSDDGRGFEPSRSTNRFGLQRVRTQMGALPGADLSVASRPGAGTVVRLSWSRE